MWTSTEPVVSTMARQAYHYLLARREWTRDNLAHHLQVGREQVSAVLEELAELGLVRPSQEVSERLEVVPPAVGWARLVAHSETALREHAARVSDVKTAMSAFLETFEARERCAAQENIEVHKGRDAAVTKVGELLAGARREVLTVVTAAPSAPTLAHARQGDGALLARGTSVRAIYLQSHWRQSRELQSYLTWLVGRGAEVRLAGTLPTRFIIADRRVLTVALDPCVPEAGAVTVTSPGLVALAGSFFDHLWAEATPLEQRNAAAENACRTTPLEVTVLRLLAEGNKDEAVSRRTGLSLRSVRRTIAGVSQRIGAASRFELGVRSSQLGLLDSAGCDSNGPAHEATSSS
ncbi:helix-turn-helix domain-containing protein [Intrasporangium sp.]|uniref:helix-turn-helix domain-containing protein n=1 Tax=Intrasporangium sp. TaxID=1925024 RepID=UPI002939F833|nr:helix-turn-helix domain-containing protein [Intrasporangium sp.]MDV3220876.1 LuxR C-terminal-related transcriptional regulator [Intrasporangium sp.]